MKTKYFTFSIQWVADRWDLRLVDFKGHYERNISARNTFYSSSGYLTIDLVAYKNIKTCYKHLYLGERIPKEPFPFVLERIRG